MHKSNLIKILRDYKDYVKCIILYGSNSAKSHKIAKSDSDFDILIVFKKDINPYEISNDIELKLKNSNAKYDYSWYTEEYFLTLIKSKIDLFLFYSIFFDGEILFSEKDFVASVKKMIEETTTTEGLLNTYAFRKTKSNNLIRLLSRNLSRLLFDYIGFCFCKENCLSTWNNLKNYNEIIEVAKSQELIDDRVYKIMRRLQELSKYDIEKVGEDNRKILSELLIFDKEIEKLIIPAGNNVYNS